MNDWAFSMTGIGRQYPHFKLQNIDLQLAKGNIMGLIGPNGAGKSTLIRILMGLVAADQGEVNVLGHPIPTAEVLAKQHIGYASEDLRLYKRTTLQWHMNFVAKIFPDQWNPTYADSLLKKFDLIPTQKIKGMSHGQRVKAALLLVLAREPQLLVLDEPTTGLDPVARKEVLNEMMAVLADDQRSVLFSSHNTQDIEQFSDQITFIDRGQLVAHSDRESFIENWRRIQVTVANDQTISTDQNIQEVIQRGQTANLVVRNYSAKLLEQLNQHGNTVQNVTYLTLEEIFVAEVEAKRSGEKA